MSRVASRDLDDLFARVEPAFQRSVTSGTSVSRVSSRDGSAFRRNVTSGTSASRLSSRDEQAFQRMETGGTSISRVSSKESLDPKTIFSRQCTEIDDLASQVIDEIVVGDVLREAVKECTFCVSIGDPRRDDCPLMAVSDEFEVMTGYTREEIIGSNCRILNRDCYIDPQHSSGLRSTCKTGQPFTGIVLNRRKSGELFQNFIDLRGLTVATNPRTGESLWFVIGIQADVTHIDEDEIPEHHFSSLQQTVDIIRAKITRALSAMAVSGAYITDIDQTKQDSQDNTWWMLPEPTLVEIDTPSFLKTSQTLESLPELQRLVTEDLDLGPPCRQVSTASQFTQSVADGRTSLFASKLTQSIADGPTPFSELMEQTCTEVDALASAFIDADLIEDAIRSSVLDCKFCVSIGDPRLPDCPLIAVSDQFEAITGYRREEIIGKNCRILNRNCKLNPVDLSCLRQACETGAPFTKLLLNRKKTGELFLNLLDLRGLSVAHNAATGENLWFLVGIQADVTHMDPDNMPENHIERLHQVATCIRAALADHVSAMAVVGTLSQSSSSHTPHNRNLWCPLQNVKWKPGPQLASCKSRRISLARSNSSRSSSKPSSRQISTQADSRQISTQTDGRQISTQSQPSSRQISTQRPQLNASDMSTAVVHQKGTFVTNVSQNQDVIEFREAARSPKEKLNTSNTLKQEESASASDFDSAKFAWRFSTPVLVLSLALLITAVQLRR